MKRNILYIGIIVILIMFLGLIVIREMKTVRKSNNIITNGGFEDQNLKPWGESSSDVTDIVIGKGVNGSKCLLLQNSAKMQEFQGDFRPSIVILKGKVFTSGIASAYVSITALDHRSRYDNCYGLRGTKQKNNIISQNKWSDFEVLFPFNKVRYADELSVYLAAENGKGNEDYVLFDDIIVELK
ncbi:MAG: hypothetical protein K9M57_06810 [Phycisphaerae bacterium]|nr:hypothetical protein [Phycisphaerae bacterium]